MRILVFGATALALLAGCGPAKCGSGDIDCFLSHLQIKQGGIVLSTVQVTLAQPTGSDLGKVSARDLGASGGPPSAPKLLGCYVDGDPRDLAGGSSVGAQTTVESCASACALQGFRYAGVQGGNSCYCGNSYGAYGQAPTTDCYFPCSGNSSEMCGGFLRNDVYDLGTAPRDLGAVSGGGGGGGGVLTGGGGAACPADHPVVCGNGYCCDSSHPICCKDGTCGSGSCTSIDLGPTGPPALVAVCPPGFPIDCSNGYCCDDAHPTCCGTQCSSSTTCDGADTPSPPSIDNQPAPESFTTDGSDQPIELDWSDPNGCQPSFCFSVCSPHVRCSGQSVCSHTVHDGAYGGVFRGTVTYTAQPTTTEQLELDVTPVSAPGCQDVPQLIQSGNDAQAITGAGASVSQTVTPPPSSSGVGGTLSCSGYNACTACSYRACASADGFGNCSAWYETPDGHKFTCAACSDCTAAATAVTMTCCPVTP